MQWKVIILCPFALGLLEAHYICLQWSSYCLNGWEMEELVCYCACDSCAREELLLACSGEKKQSLDEAGGEIADFIFPRNTDAIRILSGKAHLRW